MRHVLGGSPDGGRWRHAGGVRLERRGDQPRSECEPNLYLGALGLPLTEEADGYLHTEQLDGTRSFGVWPLAEAAPACFGTTEWPVDRPVPQVSIEFEVSDADEVQVAAQELEGQGFTFLHHARIQPWGQMVARLERGRDHRPDLHALAAGRVTAAEQVRPDRAGCGTSACDNPAMDQGPTFVERVPQVFSIALGVCGTAAGLAWDQSRPLAIVAVAGAIASLFLRVWVALRRRRRHGY